MRLSCNGCRVLRKGCSKDCIIRPCLDWINSPESQANATVFLAKFYGRAGLINLIKAGPQHLRPAIFRSLLYEACGRIVNPIYGSVGLLWSGSGQLCQAAVEAILKGEPIASITSEAKASGQGPPLKPYDIRHVSKEHKLKSQRVKAQSQFKRAMKSKSKTKLRNQVGSNLVEEANQSKCPESSLSELCKESESGVSMEASILFHDEPESKPEEREQTEKSDSDEVGLELRLGFELNSRAYHMVPLKKRKIEFELEFDFAA